MHPDRLPIRNQRGAALVEFALVLPLLLILLFSIVDFGRALNYWIDSTHLANTAARWAVVNKSPVSGSSIEDAVQQEADTNELRNGGTSSVPNALQVSICLPNGTGNVGDPVEAKTSVDYHWLPFLGLNVASTTLTASATMRLEAKYDGSSYTAGAC